MRNLVIRTHVSWYPQFLLALLRSRLTCDMVTNFNWENMIRGKYTCALIFTIAIKENFIQLWRKVFVHLVTYAIMNSWLLIAQPNCWHTDPQKCSKLYSNVYCPTMNSSHRPPWSLTNPLVSVCFRAKDDLPSSVPGRPSWDSQCRRVLLLLCKSHFERLCPDQD